ncbi:hypothetical protein [Candidatus Protofrankia californiensis]|uniref:hypothetical protein n=1 Tax=Candidatus Protofrankia californiensis TaxID=1839754 RepID=UPI0010416216|nr:hypothetical protein [Candidatus Protofrankia californiensis]
MTKHAPLVVETLDDLNPTAVFNAERDQVVVAVRITPVFGTLDLDLVAAVVDEANRAGFALVREQPFRDEWLLCVFDAYEDND